MTKKTGLKKNAFKKNRQWEVDNLDPELGYVEELKKQIYSEDPKKAQEAQEALDFLEQFNSEYYDNKGLKSEDALHNTEDLRKDCYNRTNSANRDAYGIQNSGGAVIFIDGYGDKANDFLDAAYNAKVEKHKIEREKLLNVNQKTRKKNSKKSGKSNNPSGRNK